MSDQLPDGCTCHDDRLDQAFIAYSVLVAFLLVLILALACFVLVLKRKSEEIWPDSKPNWKVAMGSSRSLILVLSQTFPI